MKIPEQTKLSLSAAASKNAPDAEVCQGKPAVHTSPQKQHKRQILDLRRKQTATEAIATLEKGVEIFGFTKGQFSVIDLINATIDKIGPADYMAISTWAAAKTDVHQVLDLVQSGKLKNARWLIDYTFQRRMPGLAQEIRRVFGPDGIRVAKNHAKFTLIKNANWQIVIRTSMNINFNPRFEDFTIAHDPELFNFIDNVLDSVWIRQGPELQFQNAGTIEKHFEDEL